jgi:hypothetical protein
LGNGGFKWMEEDWRGFWEILTYNGNSSTPMPFIPLRFTNSQTSPSSAAGGPGTTDEQGCQCAMYMCCYAS